VQRRWDDVVVLAEQAVTRDPADKHAWQLLATVRFLRGDTVAALLAWNARNEPKVDLARVDGLDRTHHQVVSDLLNLPSQSLLTAAQLERAKRRIADLPALHMSRVSYTPRARGLATIDVAVVERPLLPRTWPAAAAAGLRAATAREMRLEVASPTGNGELWAAQWRWWSNRPRLGLSVAMPTLGRWSGLWRFDTAWERETYAFAERSIRSDRRRAAVTFGDWRSGDVRWELTGAFENSTESGRHILAGAAVERRLLEDRLAVRLDASIAPIAGSAARFGTGGILSAWRVDLPRGVSLDVRSSLQSVTARAPFAFWLAADTGYAGDALLRAHPLLHNGTIRASRLGRVLAHSTVELQRDFAGLPLARLRWAIFVDAAKQSRMLRANPTTHIDAGAGLRAELPGTPGAFRVDLGRGVRDGNVVLSAAWMPSWPGW
jgi:hypothetical protein